MILKGDFFKIEAMTEANSSIMYDVSLNPEHVIFKAHFPENPIVPGVCQVQMVKELLEDKFGGELALKEVRNIKFLTILSPKDTQRLTFLFKKIDRECNRLRTNVLLYTGEKQFSKISLDFQIR